jgi:hypothetical protein
MKTCPNFSQLKNFSFVDNILYSAPFIFIFFILLKLFCLFVNKNLRPIFISFTCYTVGSYLIIFLFLYHTWEVFGIWFVNQYKYPSYERDKTFAWTNLILRNVYFVPLTIMVLTSLRKIRVYLHKVGSANKKQLVFPVFIFVITLVLFRLPKLEYSILENYFFTDNIGISTNLREPNRLHFELKTGSDSVKYIDTKLCDH